MEFRRVLFRSKRSPATESARRRRKRPIFLSMRLWYHAGTAVVPEFYGDLFHALYALGAEHDPQEKPPAHLVAPVLIENEVAERIVDVRVLVFLMLLHDMRMRASSPAPAAARTHRPSARRRPRLSPPALRASLAPRCGRSCRSSNRSNLRTRTARRRWSCARPCRLPPRPGRRNSRPPPHRATSWSPPGPRAQNS